MLMRKIKSLSKNWYVIHFVKFLLRMLMQIYLEYLVGLYYID